MAALLQADLNCYQQNAFHRPEVNLQPYWKNKKNAVNIQYVLRNTVTHVPVTYDVADHNPHDPLSTTSSKEIQSNTYPLTAAWLLMQLTWSHSLP